MFDPDLTQRQIDRWKLAFESEDAMMLLRRWTT
jgi:hypothetical protein